MEAHDQKFYDIVADEIRSRFIVDGLWVRAFSDAGGEEAKAKAIYIAHRVEHLKVEAKREQEQRDKAQREEEERLAREREAERQIPPEPDEKAFTILFWVLFTLILFFLLVVVTRK